MEMTHETGQIAGGAVQIGHPITKQTLEAVLLSATRACIPRSPTAAQADCPPPWADGAELEAEVDLASPSSTAVCNRGKSG